MSTDTQRDICSRYKQGQPLRAIAKANCTSVTQVYNAIRRAGLPLRGRYAASGTVGKSVNGDNAYFRGLEEAVRRGSAYFWAKRGQPELARSEFNHFLTESEAA